MMYRTVPCVMEIAVRSLKKSNDIYPEKEIILILLAATIGAGLLAFAGYRGHAPVAVSPVLLLVLGVLGLIYHCRIIELDQEYITVHY